MAGYGKQWWDDYDQLWQNGGKESKRTEREREKRSEKKGRQRRKCGFKKPGGGQRDRHYIYERGFAC